MLDDEALVLLTSTNKIIRMGVDEIRSVGRATIGVRLVKLDDAPAWSALTRSTPTRMRKAKKPCKKMPDGIETS